MKNIKKYYESFESLEDVKKEIKKVQSIKCRLKKQKTRKDYDKKMTEVLKKEQILKEVRERFEPKKKVVTEFTKEDVENLDYDETLKAIKSIQSKKCLSQHDEDKTEYEKAIEIEEMLIEHKKNIKPVDETTIRKTEVENLISHLENFENEVSKDYILKQLKNLIK